MNFKFDNIQEFKRFVHQLEDTDIQKFKYADWNKLYNNVETLVNKLNIEENLEHLKVEYCKKHKISSLPDMGATNFFANCICEDEFLKLNMNFKLSPDDWKNASNIAKSIAQNLYNEKIDLAACLIDTNEKTNLVNKADYSALISTKYQNDLWQFMKSKISVDEDKYLSSIGTTEYHTYNAHIDIKDMSDRVLNTSVHEACHAHFQQNTGLQIALKKENILPQMISKDLSNLFANNQKFYIIATNEFPNHILGYWSQPLEYFAKLVGSLTEREFRKLSKQYSERNFIMLNNYLVNSEGVNNPVMARYNDKNIEAFYPISDFTKIKRFWKTLPFDLKEKIKLHKSDKHVKITITQSYIYPKLKKHCLHLQETELLFENTRNSVLKRLPVIGIGVGVYLATKRYFQNKNDFSLSMYELSSGLASSTDCGIGSVAGFVIDAFLHQQDKDKLKNSNNFSNNVVYRKTEIKNPSFLHKIMQR